MFIKIALIILTGLIGLQSTAAHAQASNPEFEKKVMQLSIYCDVPSMAVEDAVHARDTGVKMQDYKTSLMQSLSGSISQHDLNVYMRTALPAVDIVFAHPNDSTLMLTNYVKSTCTLDPKRFNITLN